MNTQQKLEVLTKLREAIELIEQTSDETQEKIRRKLNDIESFADDIKNTIDEIDSLLG